MSPAPRQKPGRSKQDYQTPPEFLTVVKGWLGIGEFAVDLAADSTNAAAAQYLTAADDALSVPWAPLTAGGIGWLNPPFAHLRPWVEKARAEQAAGARLVMLVPAGVGSNWFRDHVHEQVLVIFLNGRLQFVGTPAPYPKDLLLLCYWPSAVPGYHVWDWRAWWNRMRP